VPARSLPPASAEPFYVLHCVLIVAALRAADGGGGGFGGDGGGAGAGLGAVNWSEHTLVPFEKNFYMEHPDVTAMSKEEVFPALHAVVAPRRHWR
jgi:hypothetical protein